MNALSLAGESVDPVYFLNLVKMLLSPMRLIFLMGISDNELLVRWVIYRQGGKSSFSLYSIHLNLSSLKNNGNQHSSFSPLGKSPFIGSCLLHVPPPHFYSFCFSTCLMDSSAFPLHVLIRHEWVKNTIGTGSPWLLFTLLFFFFSLFAASEGYSLQVYTPKSQ